MQLGRITTCNIIRIRFKVSLAATLGVHVFEYLSALLITYDMYTTLFGVKYYFSKVAKTTNDQMDHMGGLSTGLFSSQKRLTH